MRISTTGDKLLILLSSVCNRSTKLYFSRLFLFISSLGVFYSLRHNFGIDGIVFISSLGVLYSLRHNFEIDGNKICGWNERRE